MKTIKFYQYQTLTLQKLKLSKQFEKYKNTYTEKNSANQITGLQITDKLFQSLLEDNF